MGVMWKKLKLRILRAAFADPADSGLVSTAAWGAAERIAAVYLPHTDGEERFDDCAEAYLAVYKAIKQYQELLAGSPPELPEPPRKRQTPRRPLLERGRGFITRVVNRVRMAFRVLVLGHRPATIRFDALDRRIAECCAFWLADVITGRFVPPQESIDEDDDICRKVAWLVYEAIEAYVTYSVESEDLCKVQLASEEESRRAKEAEKGSDVPF